MLRQGQARKEAKERSREVNAMSTLCHLGIGPLILAGSSSHHRGQIQIELREGGCLKDQDRPANFSLVSLARFARFSPGLTMIVVYPVSILML